MMDGKKDSKSVRILDILTSHPEGLKFSVIQRLLWEMSHMTPFTNALRGYWCTNLLGGSMYHAGILRFFATKGADGLWRRNDVPHNGRPWATMNAVQA